MVATRAAVRHAVVSSAAARASRCRSTSCAPPPSASPTSRARARPSATRSASAPKERNDISRLVSDDADFRQRARSISAGSLAARKIGKALAAQQVAIASLEDLWAVTLSKEEAAERLSRIRAAKNRDRERAKRNEERANRSDRVSREDLAKAQDGRVGAQIRFVIEGDQEKRDRKGKKKKQPATANDLLDKLGY